MRTGLLLAAALLAMTALAPVAAADVTVPVYVCQIDPEGGPGYCTCRELTVRAPVKYEKRCSFY